MKKIIFTFDNIRKIEVFTGWKIHIYFQIGEPSADFKTEEGKEIKLREGEEIYKDRQGRIFKRIN